MNENLKLNKPIVVKWDCMKLFSQNLNKIFVFPTPESPIIKSLAKQSKLSFFIAILTKNYLNFIILRIFDWIIKINNEHAKN